MNPVGLLLVDKPEGPTSHDIVALARGAAGIRRVGHAGTLDPAASGLLLLCFGWATRLAEYLMRLPKTYHFTIRLGERTDTDDRTGTVTSRSEAWRDLGADEVRQALEAQLGWIEQRPPAYSAKKVAGRRAYRLARAGEEIELPPQQVRIERLRLRRFDPPDAELEVECSSGTYVRAIARDVGAALGVGAHLVLLRRLRIGRFTVEDAMRLTPDTSRAELLTQMRPPEVMVSHLAQVSLDLRTSLQLRQGRSLDWDGEPTAGPLAVLVGGRLAAIAEVDGGRLWPRKVFVATAAPDVE